MFESVFLQMEVSVLPQKNHFNPAIFPKSQICMFGNIWESDFW